MKWYPSIVEVVKADELKTLSKGFIFVFEFRISRTIKRDANYAVTVDVGSPDVSQNSRQSEVPTQARSPGTCASDCSLSVHVGSPNVHREFRH